MIVTRSGACNMRLAACSHTDSITENLAYQVQVGNISGEGRSFMDSLSASSGNYTQQVCHDANKLYTQTLEILIDLCVAKLPSTCFHHPNLCLMH